jgi:isopenicillin N synthase-like dioxygenase
MKKIHRDQSNMTGPPLSTVVQERHKLFESFYSAAHTTLLTILGSLSEPHEQDFHRLLMESHKPEERSSSTLALLRYPRRPNATAQGHNKHTDVGTLTLLLTKQRGLQVLLPGHEGWFGVEPRPGCAIVNVGDSLRFLSGRRFLSAVHRVVPVAESTAEDKYSIAYFLRPGDGVVLKDCGGRDYTARGWHDFKFDVFRQPHDEQERGVYSTGGMTAGNRLVVIS